MAKKKEILLSLEYLKKRGFGDPQPSPFKNIGLPYVALDGILMFYNEGELNRNVFKIGHGEMSGGIYYATTFRWIRTPAELEEIFKAVNGYTIDELLEKRNRAGVVFRNAV